MFRSKTIMLYSQNIYKTTWLNLKKKKKKNEPSNNPLVKLHSNGFESTQSKMKATWQIHHFPVRMSNSTVIIFSPCFVSPTLFILLGRSQVILQGLWKTVALCPDVPHLHLLLPRVNNFQCFKHLFLVLKLIVVNDKLKQQLIDFSLSRQYLLASYQEDVGLTLFHPSHNHQPPHPPASPTRWKPMQIYLHGLPMLPRQFPVVQCSGFLLLWWNDHFSFPM